MPVLLVNHPREDTVLKLDLRSLLAGDRLLTVDFELPVSTDRNDPSSFLYGVRFPSPMKVKGDITNTAGYMRMAITLSVDYTAACARCLSPVSGTFSLDLEKTVAPRDLLGDLTEDKLDDFVIIEDGFLDLDAALLEQLEMEFPMRFLCRDDCQGLCPKCGKNRNDGPCGCPTKEVDPRLAPLEAILQKMKDENKN